MFLFDYQCIYLICKIIIWLKIIFSMIKKPKENCINKNSNYANERRNFFISYILI